MVSKSQSTSFLLSSVGTATTILSFLPVVEQLKLQSLNKRIYEGIMPQVITTMPLNNLYIMLERNRREFYLCPFNIHAKEQKHFLLFKIGDKDSTIDRVYSK